MTLVDTGCRQKLKCIATRPSMTALKGASPCPDVWLLIGIRLVCVSTTIVVFQIEMMGEGFCSALGTKKPRQFQIVNYLSEQMRLLWMDLSSHFYTLLGHQKTLVLTET